MSDNIKNEIVKIEIPVELKGRSKQGILKAGAEIDIGSPKKKNYKFASIIIAAICLMTIGAVTMINSLTPNTDNGSYAGVLLLDDTRYIWHGDVEDNNFTPDEKLGEVQKQVEREVSPNENFTSNILEEGEEIYSSKEDNKVILVKRDYDGKYEKFAVEGYLLEE